ncbi:MAG: hypothetical protein JOS17DRAFT_822296 [Linnemannia elongata]|nr:MAG: hypothetical protein JOS17DRAFT_822296 [Linnemannia elongata]
MQTPPFHCIVCLFATLLLLATLSTLSHAFWSQQRPQQQHAKSDVRDSKDQTLHDPFARDDVVSVEEMYTLQHATDALKAYDSKPDCFKDAARALQQGCKSIDIDEDEKTRYAIRLTTCEIATANMPIPQECHSLASAEGDPNKQPTTSEISRCVQSLGRVPQLWTSYSGYFREVKVMCLAVRYSLEHDELRRLQRNLSRTHSDQISLLYEQQRVLKETNRLETERLKQLSEIHSTIAVEVNSMLNSAGTLKDALRSVTEEVSKLTQSIERGALQQGEALSTTQESNARILAEYQNTVHSALESVAQWMHRWDDSLERGLTRARKIDSLNQESIAKIAHSNEAIESITQQTATLNANLQSLHTLSSHTHTAWSSLLDTFKDDTEATLTGFRTDVKEAVRETAEGIGQMARESKENIERLSRDLEGFWRDQEEVLGRVRPLLGTWGVVKRVLESQSVFNKGGGVRGGGGRELMVPWMWSGFVLLYFVVATVLTLIYGVRTALIPMVASVAITILCEWWRLPTVSFIHLFMGIVCFRWGLYSIRSWRYYYHSRHQFLLWQFCAHLLDRCRVLRNAQRDDAVEQEKEKEYEYGVVDEYGESYLDMDSAEEEEDLEMEEHVWQQYNDDTSELRATGRYNNPNSPSTPAPSAMKPKRQDQYRSLGIDLNPLTRPSMDMDMDEWESVAASWDLSLGTCISSSSTSSDIY